MYVQPFVWMWNLRNGTFLVSAVPFYSASDFSLFVVIVVVVGGDGGGGGGGGGAAAAAAAVIAGPHQT